MPKEHPAMSHELDLVKDSPREVLLKTIREEREKRMKALEIKKKEDQERILREKERDKEEALLNALSRKRDKIFKMKSQFTRRVKNLASNYFSLSQEKVEEMPKKQFQELIELIAYTARRRLLFQLICLPVTLPIKFLAWALRWPNGLTENGVMNFIFGGMASVLVVSGYMGISLMNSYPIMGWICVVLGLVPWTTIISAGILKAINKIETVDNFSYNMKGFECLSGWNYLYSRYRLKQKLEPAELVKFLENEARS